MNPVLLDVLLQWKLWPQIVLILVTAGVLYTRGWLHFRRRGHAAYASGPKLASFLAGLFFLGIAMLSPLEVFYNLLFSVHMVQHLLIAMVGPPLLMLADPFPFLLWGLPRRIMRPVAGAVRPRGRLATVLGALTRPWVVWFVYVGITWLWHIPGVYDAAVVNEFVHLLEHSTLFGSAVLFWWHVTAATPHPHGRLGYGFRIAFTIAAVVPNEILGVGITFAGQPLYSHYANVARPFNLSVMDDQGLAGALMWALGGMMYVLAGVLLIGRMLEMQERAERKAQERKLSYSGRGQ